MCSSKSGDITFPSLRFCRYCFSKMSFLPKTSHHVPVYTWHFLLPCPRIVTYLNHQNVFFIHRKYLESSEFITLFHWLINSGSLAASLSKGGTVSVTNEVTTEELRSDLYRWLYLEWNFKNLRILKMKIFQNLLFIDMRDLLINIIKKIKRT